MILHHYAVSPLSEKIRLMLGYCDMEWQSVISPPMPPRRIVDPLIGGYRRIPIAQIGADFFCDSRLIATEIARLAEQPQIVVENNIADVQAFVEFVDVHVFMAVVHTLSPMLALAMLARHYWPWQIAALLKDRAQMAKSSALPRRSHEQMITILNEFKHDLEQRLGKQMYLFDGQPNSADFAAYYVVWFANKTRRGDFLAGFPNAQAWFAKIVSIGHGKWHTLNKRDVFKIAHETQPQKLSDTMAQGKYLGAAVSIRPCDYAHDATQGVLVGQDQARWIIARETNEFGLLHVHFPKKGYAVEIVS